MKRKESTHSEDPIYGESSSSTSPKVGDYEGGTKRPKGNYCEVFLSFRGEDTRKGFTDHLYNSLADAGIQVFRDDNELPVGEKIDLELLCSIAKSKISIPIISENYASSKWCLRELAEMLKYKRSNGQIVLPIFYKVEPSQVRHPTGKWRDAIDDHKTNMDKMVVKEWEEALEEVSSLKGWESEKIDNGKGIEVLSFMSLIKIDEEGKLMMHDQLRDLGREIVRLENRNEPQERSRLWIYEEALDVLDNNKGTRKIEALSLGECGQGRTYTGEQFKQMTNLRFLLADGANFTGDFKSLLPKLRWLQWLGCPSDFTATNFHPKKLVVLDLSCSAISEDWGGWVPLKKSPAWKVHIAYPTYPQGNALRYPELMGLKILRH